MVRSAIDDAGGYETLAAEVATEEPDLARARCWPTIT